MIKNTFKIDKRYLGIMVIGFLTARAILPGGLIPFGYGFFAASLEHNVSSIVVGIITCAGALTTGFNARSLIVVISILSLAAFKILAVNTNKSANKLIPFILSGMASSLLVVVINGFELRDLFMAFLQSALSAVGYFIFQGSLRAISSKRGRYVLKEDVSSIAITLILCIFGFPNIIFFGLNLRNVIGIFFIIVFSYKNSYGLLAKLGKVGTCVVIFIVSTSVTFMLGSSDEIVKVLLDTVAADFIFFILPEKLLNRLRLPGATNINAVVEKANYSEDMTAMMVGRLVGYSQSYSVLAKSFSNFAKGVSPEVNGKRALIERVGSRICEDCDMTDFCWKNNKVKTSKAFSELYESIELGGKIVWEDVPEFFKEECEKTQNVLAEMRVGYEVGRVEKLWSKKLAESKDIYAMQLGSLANAAHNLAMEMKNDIKLMVKISETMDIEFKKSGYRWLRANVIQNRFGKYEVTVDFKNPVKYDNGILRIICSVLKRKMIPGSEMISENIRKYVEANKFNIKTGAAYKAKNPKEVSGDSYSFINVGNGFYAAVLCDGMGTGKKAREMSMLAVKMIENFSFNGFDNETAIEMINSAMVMKNEEDSYSTLDLVSVNLQNGNVDILKYGSMPTVIKYNVAEEEYREKRNYMPGIESVTAQALPVGIMSKVSGKTIKKKVSAGDCIIMMSDGVFDSYRQIGKSNGDLVRFIELLDCDKPQEIAEKILDEASAVNYGTASESYKLAAGEGDDLRMIKGKNFGPADDMTVLVMSVTSF